MSVVAVAPVLAVAVGLAALAAAMGIGRFAFTPLLPLMQAEGGVTLAQGAWLAASNYLGYLVGAIASFWLAPRPVVAARGGLVVVALSTLAMGVADSVPAWIGWRFVAGVASAWVLVGASGWALAHLAAAGLGGLGGAVFAGVGCGIVVAGLTVLAMGAMGASAAAMWIALGAMALAVAAAAWPPLGAPTTAGPLPSTAAAQPLNRAAWALIASYGLLGLGYIVPATFLPAAARELVADPSVFGLAWPAFGAAAMASTIAVGAWLHATPPRSISIGAHVVMALGVLAPVWHASLVAIVLSALAVGGTFMVATMAGMQEARRIASGSPTRLMSAMTASFALGQLIGPLLVTRGESALRALAGPSVAAASLLLVGAVLLAITTPNPPRKKESP